MTIQTASDLDLDTVLSIERAAFGQDDEAELVKALLEDPSAQPTLSLLAFQADRAVGHILFTTAHLKSPQTTTSLQTTVSIALLAPLAVVPDAQGQGIGGQLIKRGLQLLSQSGTALVFVLGHPDYYPRHGFQPAGQLGFEAPYPILAEQADAWMVQALCPNVIGTVSGKVVCADVLSQPEYWRE
ncbi:MAG: N-acetyltransferase [Cyanobacteria bacterium P01_G01_bin.38]